LWRLSNYCTSSSLGSSFYPIALFLQHSDNVFPLDILRFALHKALRGSQEIHIDSTTLQINAVLDSSGG